MVVVGAEIPFRIQPDPSVHSSYLKPVLDILAIVLPLRKPIEVDFLRSLNLFEQLAVAKERANLIKLQKVIVEFINHFVLNGLDERAYFKNPGNVVFREFEPFLP